MNEFHKLQPQPNPEATYPVQYVSYRLHQPKRKRVDSGGYPLSGGARPTMEVIYFVTSRAWVTEWIAFEGAGWARTYAVRWWLQRSRAPVPATAAEAVALADKGALAQVQTITVRRRPHDRFPRIVGWTFGPIPEFAAVAQSTPQAAESQSVATPPDETIAERRRWYTDDPGYWDALDDAV